MQPESDKTFSIPGAALSALLSAHDGDEALLYLYLLSGGEDDLNAAANALNMTGSRVRDAEEKLKRAGIYPAPKTETQPAAAEVKLPPPPETPQYTSQEIVERTRSDPQFLAILDEMARIIGRKLSSVEVNTMFGIYDYLGLPADVAITLIDHVAQRYADCYGTTRRPTVRAIEKEAYIWANEGISTYEQAEAFIEGRKAVSARLERLRGAVNITGRALTASEEKYLLSWLDMGFEERAVAIAYDRTVTNTGALKWPYMDKILRSWHEKKLHTPEEIRLGDGRTKTAGSRQQPAAVAVDPEELKKILDKI